MKKTIFALAAGLLFIGMATSCSKKDNNADTSVDTTVAIEGEVVEMPTSDSDSTVVAAAVGEAVSVDTVVTK